MDAKRKGSEERELSPVSRRVFLAAAPAAAALSACGGGGSSTIPYGDVYGDYANCYYCDGFVGGFPVDYTCCDGRFTCDGFCA